MIKIDLARVIAEKMGVTQDQADTLITAFTESIGESLEKGERVQLAGFGQFDIRFVPQHQGRNPKTGEALLVPATCYPTFKAGKGLKERVAQVPMPSDTDTTTPAETTTAAPKATRKKKD